MSHREKIDNVLQDGLRELLPLATDALAKDLENSPSYQRETEDFVSIDRPTIHKDNDHSEAERTRRFRFQ